MLEALGFDHSFDLEEVEGEVVGSGKGGRDRTGHVIKCRAARAKVE
jgi:hypothetical protein